MDKWEYKVVRIRKDWPPATSPITADMMMESLFEKLNELGQDGWELMEMPTGRTDTMTFTNPSFLRTEWQVFLKRRKP